MDNGKSNEDVPSELDQTSTATDSSSPSLFDHKLGNGASNDVLVVERRMSKGSLKVPSSDNNKQIKSPQVILTEETFEASFNERRYYTNVERTNLLLLFKLVVKELLAFAMNQKRVVDFNEKPLRHFFILLEMALSHGIKSKKSLLSSRRELWHLLEIVPLKMPEASSITTSARDLPNARTNVGRSRAWLRLAFMQKLLPDYFKYLVDKKETLLADFFEADAFMMNDEATVVAGLLIGLSVVDANGWCGKDEDLDFQRNLIELRPYLKDGSHLSSSGQSDDEDNIDIKEVLDQKNYLEEMNRHLQATIEDMKRRNEICGVTSAMPRADKTSQMSSRDRISPDVLNCHRRTDSAEIKETTANAIRFEERYNFEKQQKDNVQRELQTQVNINNELETAMKLLETDIHEKQDTIISLRRQLDDIKTINLQLYSRLKDSDTTIVTKTDQMSQLEGRASSDAKLISQLEEKIAAIDRKRCAFEEVNKKQILQLLEIDNKRLSTEGDLKIEREWRTSLKQIVDDQQEQITALQYENETLKAKCSDLDNVRADFKALQLKCGDYELSLEEIGLQLRDSKLEMDDLMECSGTIMKAVWTSDKDAKDCAQCTKPFSVSRRKHHCRNCGNIYCASCSDNKLPLASSAKPVRVCDGCHTLLLERYSAK